MHRWWLQLEELQAEALQVGVKWKAVWYAVAPLAAAAEVLPKPSEQMTVQTVKHSLGMTVAKIRLPAPKSLVDPGDQHRWRHPAPFGSSQFT